MSTIVIAGGHGHIGLLLARQLRDAGDEPVALIRNPDHAEEVTAAGAEPLILDLENIEAHELAAAISGADAVVFAAGAGPNSGPERKLTVDRDGAILLAAAAQLAGVDRFVMISAMAADDYDADSDDVFQIYLKAKADADRALRNSDLDWTIIRPGGLTDDEPTGRVTIAESTGRGTIPRADVAALVVASLAEPETTAAQFEAISGDTPIAEALAALAPADEPREGTASDPGAQAPAAEG
ncbi:SDR family oxidoreductase [Mycetocola reblochoni]|uniref:SDR family oxidoreductase n=1 Tax=Mycetocola reblochoni TaxID=331618 RepID=A0A3L6ZRV3_9MICO|nr:SDR family oxidoreductase [Mycetocola reblochoni]RLP70578.1 SDR family oxidoreductase [Mycetocola reblochoni]